MRRRGGLLRAVATAMVLALAPTATSRAALVAGEDPPFAIAVSPSLRGPVLVSQSGAVSKPLLFLPGLSFVVRHPTLAVFYVAHELGPRNHRITAFVLTDGGARVIGTATTGAAPVHIAVDPLGRFLVSADYNGGGVTKVMLDRHGVPRRSLRIAVPGGSGPDRDRQRSPHPHSVALSADGLYAVVADLGTDSLLVYETGGFGLLATEQLPPGTGPRTAVFEGPFMLVVSEELSGTVSWWAFDAGRLRLVKRSFLDSGAPSDVIVAERSSTGPGVLVIGRSRDELIEVGPDGLGRRWALGACGARVGRWTDDGELVLACGRAGVLRRARLGPTGTLTEKPATAVGGVSGLAMV